LVSPPAASTGAPPTFEEEWREREKEGLPSIENGGTQEEAENITIDTIRRRKNLIHPMVHIKRLIIDSSDLQIMRVSSQTVAFR
jgi:hypothetical protein